MGKAGGTVILALLVAGTAYTIRNCWGRRTRDGHRLPQAIVCMEKQDFHTALEHLRGIRNKSYEVCLKMYICHEGLGNITDAIIYINRCISMEFSPDLVEKRYLLNKRARMHRDAFKDIFMLNMIDKGQKYNEETSRCLKTYSMLKADSYQIVGWASKINFADFFDTLFFIKDLQDPTAVFIESEEYEKCFDLVRDGSSDLHRFLKGCFCYVNGDLDGAAEALRDEEYMYSRVLHLFIKTGKSKLAVRGDIKDTKCTLDSINCAVPDDESKDTPLIEPNALPKVKNNALAGLSNAERALVAQCSGSKDPTILFYLAKILGNLGMQERELRAINQCLKINETAAALSHKIVILITQNKGDESMSLINRALDAFPESINLHCIAIEYFLYSQHIQRSVALLLRIESHHSSDARISLFKYLLSKAAGAPDIGFLRAAIEADPRYYKPYIHLGNHLMGTEESMHLYRKALECARNFNELYTAFQLLIVVEAQDDLLRDYPGLFER